LIKYWLLLEREHTLKACSEKQRAGVRRNPHASPPDVNNPNAADALMAPGCKHHCSPAYFTTATNNESLLLYGIVE